MTEVEWLAATNPTPMLEFLRGRSSERKLRLFSVACVRRIENLLSGGVSLIALEWAEQCIEGNKDCADDELYVLQSKGVEYAKGLSDAEWPNGWSAEQLAAYYAAISSSDCVRPGLRTRDEWTDQVDWISISSSTAVGYFQSGTTSIEHNQMNAERAVQTRLLRDIFGNPFRTVAVDPSWLSSTAVAIAQGIYEEKAFDRLPILADALQDAGCEHPDILNHLRSPGPHVRGCWALDLVLGKS